MVPEPLGYILFSFSLAAFLKGITGLGFSTICLPLLSYVLEPKTAIPLVILPSLSSNLFVMVQAGNFIGALKRFWQVYVCALPGLMIGVWYLYRVDSAVSRACLGIILVLYALWALTHPEVTFARNRERRLGGPVGFCTGIINGLTGSQIMPVLPYMLSLRIDKDTFIQSINLFFTISSLTMILLLGRYDLMTENTLAVSVPGIAFVGLGIVTGGKLRKYLPEDRYKTIVLIFLLLTGAFLIFRMGLS